MVTRNDKMEYINKEFLVIERLQMIHDDYNKKLKEAVGVYRRPPPSLLTKDDKIVFEVEEKKAVWTEYITNLFSDSTRTTGNHAEESNMTDMPITQEEVENAIQLSKNNKSPGPDEIPCELFKLIDESNIKIIVKLFNNIYDTGIYPHDWLKSTFITLPKRSYVKKCSDYRLISLMSHSLKIFLKIIHNRIHKQCELAMGETQNFSA